ncbi:MAG: phospholipase D-like domain-containing protein [Planctomycetaceae bacterium]
MDTSEFERQLRESFEDMKMSRAERSRLRDWVDAQGCSGQQRAQLRNLAFAEARDQSEGNDPQLVLSWLENVLKTVYPTDAIQEIAAEVWFSPEQRCVSRIDRLICDARRSVSVCVFTVTDNRLANSLLEAHRRGVSVRLITDNEKSDDLGSDVDQLQAAGIPVLMDQSRWHMHHKFAIVDSQQLLTGSYNWTRGAAENNEENFVITDHVPLVRRYVEYFDQFWERLQQSG